MKLARKNVLWIIFLIFLALLVLVSSVQAAEVTFKNWKATRGGSYELPGVSSFYPNETIYVWINVTNDQNYKNDFLIMETESYRIDPNGDSLFIDKNKIFMFPKEGDVYWYDYITVDAWNVSQSPIYGSYSYRILYSLYRASDGSIIETGGVRVERLISIVGGAPPPSPTILSIKVANKDSVPIPRARIYIDNQMKGQTYTTGRYNLQDPPLGKHSIKVTKTGYKDAVLNANIIAGKTTSLAITLETTVDEISGSPTPVFSPRPIPGFDVIFALTALVLTVFLFKCDHFQF